MEWKNFRIKWVSVFTFNFMEINCLFDLNGYRTAPSLNYEQRKKLLKELGDKILSADWITVGIMALNDYEAINALQSISVRYSLNKFKDLSTLKANGNVYLKGNQKTGNVYIRSENALGEGILLTCQYEEGSLDSNTFGPFPLDFFSN